MTSYLFVAWLVSFIQDIKSLYVVLLGSMKTDGPFFGHFIGYWHINITMVDSVQHMRVLDDLALVLRSVVLLQTVVVTLIGL